MGLFNRRAETLFPSFTSSKPGLALTRLPLSSLVVASFTENLFCGGLAWPWTSSTPAMIVTAKTATTAVNFKQLNLDLIIVLSHYQFRF